jgi:hypothetical protein
MTLLGEFDVLLCRFEHGARDPAPFVDDRVGGFGDDPRAEAHRPRRSRAPAGQHTVGITGQ